MPTHLREFIDCLQGQEIRPTGEELADVLWLALRMGELETAKAMHETSAEETKSAAPTQVPAEQTPEPERETVTSTVPHYEEKGVPLYADAAPVSAPGLEDRSTTGARPFRTPAAPALPDSLALSRALRPLMRKIPSHSRRMVDETATAERYAERTLWLPVFRGEPERWLELALVVDASPSLRLWQPTLADLYRLLANHGAFRDVRVWHLGTDTNGKPFLSKRADGTQPRRPEELLHPEGRRLVVLVSDCAVPTWYGPKTFDPWLRLWSRHQPLALLHLLPPRFWPRGGLRRARLAQFRALAPGQPNPQLIPDATDLPSDPLFLPVFTLEPESVALWAHLLSGQGEAWSPGAILDKVKAFPSPSSTGKIPAEQRIRQFRRSASPEAQVLARYCAAVPLTLPVMRLLQTELLPQSRQVHLAEVFFSGLIRRVNPQESDPELFLYDFRPDLRDMLLDTLRAPRILEIHQRLSEAVRRNLGMSADFLAFIPDLLEDGGLRLDKRSLPFAEVGVTVLSRLGGGYAARAEQLARVIENIKKTTTARSQAVSEGVSDQETVAEPTKPTEPTSFRDSFLDGRAKAPDMIWLPGGTFTMGDDKSGRDNEKPAHQVTLSHFGVGKYPVTFEEYDAFCEATGRKKPNDQGWGRSRRPVINLSWDDARDYCRWLSKQTGQDYRLLTEAQWEYACRAGNDAAYCFGDDRKQLDEYAWYWDNSEMKTHTVGEKKPNAWDLHDLHGNVWEWVQDWYGDYSGEPQSNPSGPESGSYRVARGGSWRHDAGSCRSADRRHWPPEYRGHGLGFRLARLGPLPSYPFTLPPEPPPLPETPVPGLRDPLADGSSGPAMAWLPGATFIMGDDKSQRDNEKPAHEVTLSAFSIGQYPVTFEEYDKFCEATGREAPSDSEWGRGKRPAMRVSYEDAAAYCEWLSQQTRAHYRLLTEAEWEYACRAGSATRYCFGDDEQRLGDYAWYSKNAEGKTHPVGEKRPNDWQLYDMHGNVWEWVRDWYVRYSSESQSNPSGPESGSSRVYRGGGWRFGADFCRSAYRRFWRPGYRGGILGFRLARDGAWLSYPFTLGPGKTAETSDETTTGTEQKKSYQPYEVLQDAPDASEMVYLTGGTFKMGDIQGIGLDRERPVHEVTLDAFAIGRYPVTIGEYMRFVEATKSHYPEWLEEGSEYHIETGNDDYYRRVGMSLENSKHPIVGISWSDAVAYCEWLSEQTGEQYELPSEAEWEYACRASSKTAYCFGDDEQRLGDYAWYTENAGGKTHPVEEKQPNDWGLYDMHGNVWEWVRDWYGDYSSEPQNNPSGPETGSYRVYRGGSWVNVAGDCRSAYRSYWPPGYRHGLLGFRLARKV